MLLALISGCGDSSKSRSYDVNSSGGDPVVPPPDNPTEVVAMVLDEPYQVNKNDEINKTSNEARVAIIHFEDGNTAAILRVGSATLTKY